LVKDIPTVAESGVPGFDVSSWYALFLPVKNPTEIKNRSDAGSRMEPVPVRAACVAFAPFFAARTYVMGFGRRPPLWAGTGDVVQGALPR
jgi:hypothetical protein